MDTENNVPAPAWEACKENVLPIKRGRSAKGLSESLQKNSDSATIDKVREKLFEDTIIAAGKSSPKELLSAYVLYFKWTRDTYPSNVEKPLNLLEVKHSTFIFPNTDMIVFYRIMYIYVSSDKRISSISHKYIHL